jgi:hypothetical protein
VGFILNKKVSLQLPDLDHACVFTESEHEVSFMTATCATCGLSAADALVALQEAVEERERYIESMAYEAMEAD